MRRIATISFSLGILLLVLAVPALHAGWVEDGIDICTAGGEQSHVRIVSDGTGGAIIAWHDNRGGGLWDWDIYVQLVDALGVPKWTADGVAICTAGQEQEMPAIASDGAAGAVVVWVDNRDYMDDIYAQRVSSSGLPLWASDGVAVCATPEDQREPQIIADGVGGCIIVWEDDRGGSSTADIYAQRLDASGAPQWAAHGVVVCAGAARQWNPQITTDGSGGAIFAWFDSRNGSLNMDIYAQRLNASGAAQWTADGVAICAATGNQTYPQLISDGAGGAIITWQDSFTGSAAGIYAQRVNAFGEVQWTVDGVAVCTAAESQTEPQIVADGAGGAIIVWEDMRTYTKHIYAQRINGAGVVQWAANGVAIDAPAYQDHPRIVPDGAGGAVIAWGDFRSAGAYDVYAQRINSSGNALWTAGGVVVSAAVENQQNPCIATDGSGGAIIAWEDTRSATSIDVYSQRITSAGQTIATLLQSFSCAYSSGAVRIEWELSDVDADARFFVSRASSPGWQYEEIHDPAIERTGRSFAFTDESCRSGFAYSYRVEYATFETGRRVLFETERIATPDLSFALHQNAPNPFNPSTTIRFRLPIGGRATLEVLDVSGRLVQRLFDREMEAGEHDVVWDGRDSRGNVLPGGVYFCRLRSGKFSETRKLVLLR